MLPETGASSIWAPRRATLAASRRLACGLTVLMSMYTCSGLQAGEDPVRAVGDRIERVVVGDHADDDVGRGRDFARGVSQISPRSISGWALAAVRLVP